MTLTLYLRSEFVWNFGTNEKWILLSYVCLFVDIFAGQQEEIELQNLDGNTVISLIEFAYTGQIVISQKNIEVLVETANFLAVESVINACIDFLIANMTLDNCIEFCRFADIYALTGLRDKSMQLILR